MSTGPDRSCFLWPVQLPTSGGTWGGLPSSKCSRPQCFHAPELRRKSPGLLLHSFLSHLLGWYKKPDYFSFSTHSFSNFVKWPFVGKVPLMQCYLPSHGAAQGCHWSYHSACGLSALLRQRMHKMWHRLEVLDVFKQDLSHTTRGQKIGHCSTIIDKKCEKHLIP